MDIIGSLLFISLLMNVIFFVKNRNKKKVIAKLTDIKDNLETELGDLREKYADALDERNEARKDLKKLQGAVGNFKIPVDPSLAVGSAAVLAAVEGKADSHCMAEKKATPRKVLPSVDGRVAPVRGVTGVMFPVSKNTKSPVIVHDSGSSASDMLVAGAAGYMLGNMMSGGESHHSSPSPEPSFHTGGGDFSGGGATHDYSSHSSCGSDSGFSDSGGGCDCGGGDGGGGGD